MKHSQPVPMLCLMVGFLWLGITAPAAGQAPVAGQAPAAGKEKHPWARFGVGSWKQVRVYSETLNSAGKVDSTSITDTKTTLMEITSTGYTLKMEVTVDVSGKRFTAAPRMVRQGFNGEANGQTVEIQKIGPRELEIDGRKYPVEYRKVVINGDELKRVSFVHYSDNVAPHVLKRETTAMGADGGKLNFESLVMVVAVDMPHRVLSESKLVSLVKTSQRQANGNSSVTLEVHCHDVPGGVVSHTAKEMNEAGQVISRSSLELTEYEVVQFANPADPQNVTRRRVFHRSRGRMP